MASDCDYSFWRLIGLTAQAMRSYADQRLKKFDLTVEQLQLLKVLDSQEGQAQHVLGTLTGKSPANITRLLDRLENKGRIVRGPNPDDRRSSLVYLSREGARLREEVTRLFEGLREDLVASISEKDQRIAVNVLQTIRANIDSMSKNQGGRE